MFSSLSTLLSTVTGKAVAGLVVASTSVGAAAAAGVEVPVPMPFQSGDPVVEIADEPADEPEPEIAEEPEQEAAEEPGVEAEDGDEDGEEPNHGEVVSTFTQETELEGCAKGQATAAVARGDVDPNAEGFDDSAFDEYTAKCKNADGEDGEDGEDGDEVDADESKAAFKDAQSAYDELCGDDDEDGEESTEGTEADDDGDEPMSEECQALKQAAKDAHGEWKDARQQDKPEKADKADKSDKGGSRGKSADAPGKNK